MNRGIAGIPLTLEQRIEAYLSGVPTDAELADTYVDPTDRERVRRRKLIAAVLDAAFKHGFQGVGPKGIEVEVDMNAPPDVWSGLADARRDLLHDFDKMDRGFSADALLVPATKDALPDEVVNGKAISYRRTLLIKWLAAADLWTKADAPKYPTRNSIYQLGEKFAEFPVSTLESEHSRMRGKKRFSKNEQRQFNKIVIDMKTAGNEGNQTPLSLYLPALIVISRAFV